MWRTLGTCALAVCVVAGCGVSSSSPLASAPAPSIAVAPSPVGSASPAPAPSVPPTPTAAPTPSPVATPPAASPPPASPAARPISLDAILEVDHDQRFETFGDELIDLPSVWSPADLGLGGTCQASEAWLECGLEDWIIQPEREAQPGDYGGPRLDVLFAPEVRDSLGRSLRPGEGPLHIVGRFGHPASLDCRPENRDACRDHFVVTVMDLPD